MKARVLRFEAPYEVGIEERNLPPPARGEVLVRSLVSAISAGTELLFYRGRIAEGTALDESLGALGAPLAYPMSYGYAVAGEVVAHGEGVGREWIGRRVFAFQLHASAFVAPVEELFELPEGTALERAALLPTAETAVNLLLDAEPLVGERVLVLGQGVVGLVTAALLAEFPLARLVTVDPIEARRELSLRLGAHRALGSAKDAGPDFDLALELSGSPRALNAAIAAVGPEGRIVVGSWYGDEPASVELGTHFHRARLSLRSSQVSNLAPERRGRWSKRRRLEVAFDALGRLPAAELVSHRFPLARAAEAYRLLAERPEECRQVLLTYT